MFLTTRNISEILQNKTLRTCLRIDNQMDVIVSDIQFHRKVQPYDTLMRYFLQHYN